MADPTRADVVCNQAAMQSSISEVKQHQFKAVISASRALANTRFTLTSSQCIRMTNDQVNLLLYEKFCFFLKKKMVVFSWWWQMQQRCSMYHSKADGDLYCDQLTSMKMVM